MILTLTRPAEEMDPSRERSASTKRQPTTKQKETKSTGAISLYNVALCSLASLSVFLSVLHRLGLLRDTGGPVCILVCAIDTISR